VSVHFVLNFWVGQVYLTDISADDEDWEKFGVKITDSPEDLIAWVVFEGENELKVDFNHC
jgi:hypothetical protein